MLTEDMLSDSSYKYIGGSAYDGKVPEGKNFIEYIQENLTIWGTPRYVGPGYNDKVKAEDIVIYANEVTGNFMKSEYVREPVPQLTFTLNKLVNDIGTYRDEMAAKFVAGQESLNNWDSYVNTFKKMNVDEVVKIYQTAYDRWLKVMK